MEYKCIEYICRYCGMKILRSKVSGRPQPGTCKRKEGNKPHSWIVNRRI